MNKGLKMVKCFICGREVVAKRIRFEMDGKVFCTKRCSYAYKSPMINSVYLEKDDGVI